MYSWVKIFFPFHVLPINLNYGVFHCRELFSFMWSHLSVVGLNACNWAPVQDVLSCVNEVKPIFYFLLLFWVSRHVNASDPFVVDSCAVYKTIIKFYLFIFLHVALQFWPAPFEESVFSFSSVYF